MKKKNPPPVDLHKKNGKVYDAAPAKILAPSMRKAGVKQLPNSSAQSYALNSKVSFVTTESLTLGTLNSAFRHHSEAFRALIWLIWASGARISEILQIKSSGISNDLRILISGSKNSNSRFILGTEFASFFSRCRDNNIHPFQEFDRFFVYRELKKKGFSMYFGDNQNAAVTHAFRHLAVLDMQPVDKELTAAQQTIGHKANQSTHVYGKKRRK